MSEGRFSTKNAVCLLLRVEVFFNAQMKSLERHGQTNSLRVLPELAASGSQVFKDSRTKCASFALSGAWHSQLHVVYRCYLHDPFHNTIEIRCFQVLFTKTFKDHEAVCNTICHHAYLGESLILK
jgi:hypothetical protein